VTSRLAAVGVGLAVGLVLCEVLLRTARPGAFRSGLEDAEPFVVPDAALGWVGSSNLRIEARFDPDYRHEVSTNSRGFRNRETSYARDARRRILCIGDSFTWGLGVESRGTFPSLLERGLSKTEVINSGVIGWGTAQEWLWLEREGQRYSPDILILGFFVNDFWDNEGNDLPGRRPIFAVSAGGEPVLRASPPPPPERSWSESILRYLRGHSQVFRAVQFGAEWVRVGFFRVADLTPLERAPFGKRARLEPTPAQEITFALLERIRTFCDQRGIRLIVLLIPSHWDVRPGLEGTPRGIEFHEAYETAIRLCRTLDIDTVDLRPRLLEMERQGSSGFHRIDIHLNAGGHRAAADLLMARIQAR
jgi:lysophospholipase L1-like esterase